MNSAKDSGELAQSKFDSSTNIYELHVTHWHVPLRWEMKKARWQWVELKIEKKGKTGNIDSPYRNVAAKGRKQIAW